LPKGASRKPALQVPERFHSLIWSQMLASFRSIACSIAFSREIAMSGLSPPFARDQIFRAEAGLHGKHAEASQHRRSRGNASKACIGDPARLFVLMDVRKFRAPRSGMPPPLTFGS